MRFDYATAGTSLFAHVVDTGEQIMANDGAQLRKAVDALRSTTGLPAAFSSGGPVTGNPIAASDFTNLVNALNAARGYYPLAQFTWDAVLALRLAAPSSTSTSSNSAPHRNDDHERIQKNQPVAARCDVHRCDTHTRCGARAKFRRG